MDWLSYSQQCNRHCFLNSPLSSLPTPCIAIKEAGRNTTITILIITVICWKCYAHGFTPACTQICMWMCVALPIVGTWSMTVLQWQLLSVITFFIETWDTFESLYSIPYLLLLYIIVVALPHNATFNVCTCRRAAIVQPHTAMLCLSLYANNFETVLNPNITILQLLNYLRVLHTNELSYILMYIAFCG